MAPASFDPTKRISFSKPASESVDDSIPEIPAKKGTPSAKPSELKMDQGVRKRIFYSVCSKCNSVIPVAVEEELILKCIRISGGICLSTW